MNKKIGSIKKEVLNLFQIKINHDIPVFIGDANINHIKTKHPKDYQKYGDKIKEIIIDPTYVAKHPKKESIEFIKEYKETEDYLLVAVKITIHQVAFIKTMFVMSETKKEKYLKSGFLRKILK